MAAEINLTNVGTLEHAEPLVRALNGATSYKLYINLCPGRGSFSVNVGTLDPDVDTAELTGMVLMVMAGEIMRAGRS